MSRIHEIILRLNMVMEETGWSQRKWAARATIDKHHKVSPNYISTMKTRADTGEITDVKNEKLRLLANAAGVDLGWLMGEGPREPIRRAGETVTSPAPAVDELAHAIRSFKFPPGCTAAQAVAIRDRAQAEADATPTARTLPADFWIDRLGEIAAEVMGPSRSHVQPTRRRANDG